MEPNHKTWNKQQRVLREMLLDAERHPNAIELFLHQHAAVHSAKILGTGTWSFEDEVLDDMNETQLRRVPTKGGHSIAWLTWHIARIEDVAMNMLVAGSEQIFLSAGWFDRLGVPFRHTGNLMPARDIEELSANIDNQALREYRVAVGRKTQEIVVGLGTEDLKHKVSSARLQQILDVGAVIPAAQDLLDYWSRRTIAGLLLMPPTRHNFIHLNEVLKVKKKNK